MITKIELINEMQDIDVVRCIMSDGYEFHIGQADYWVGGTDDGYMCDLIGNIQYPSIDSCVNALFSYMDKNGMSIESIE